MTDRADAMDTQPMAHSAGGLLRAARQAQGLHIAALAMQLKVTPRKLEALEADRYDELQGPAFVRALAQAACRALKINPAPIMERLPSVEQRTLDAVGAGLNAPFREHGARREPLRELGSTGRGVLTVVAVLLLGAGLLWFVPPGFQLGSVLPALQPAASANAVLAAAPVASEASAATPAVATAAPAAPPPAAATTTGAEASLPPPPALEPAHLLQVHASAESWVEVVDGAGQALLSRTLQPGESVDLDGALPLRVKIGNASGTELRLRGQPVDLTSSSRDNVARLDLK